jgi:RNA polymerase sigma-70 factor, ECF subfamily
MVNQQLQDAVKECQQGNLADFGVIYDLFIQRIYDYLYYRTRHKQVAEDLTSLTFTKALQNIKAYDEQKGEFSAWIYRIARNALIDHYRAHRSTSNIDEAWEVKTDSNLESDLDAQTKLEEVREYLDQLNPEHRELVVMRVWDNLSYNEIAAITGKTESSLKMSMSRILAKLRNEVVAAIALLLILN